MPLVPPLRFRGLPLVVITIEEMKSLLDDGRKETSRDLDLRRFELATRTCMTCVGELNQEFDIKLTNLATKLQAQVDELRFKSPSASSSASKSAWGNRSQDDSATSSPQYNKFKSSPAASDSNRANSQPPTFSSGYSADPASLIIMGFKDKCSPSLGICCCRNHTQG